MNRKNLLTVLSCIALGAGHGFATQTAETPAVDITLQRAIEMALENNLDVVVSRLDTQVRSEGVSAARGVYTPSVAASFNNLDTRSPAQNQLIGAPVLTSTRTDYNLAFQQELGTGGNYNVVWQNLRSTTNSAFSGFSANAQPIPRGDELPAPAVP